MEIKKGSRKTLKEAEMAIFRVASLATGIDIVSIGRMRAAAQRERFCERVFTGAELVYSRKKRAPHKHLAGRFAAKEACVKALSRAGDAALRGLHPWRWTDIEVVNEKDGSPAFLLHAAAAKALKGRKVFLSITYSKGLHPRQGLALAIAVIEGVAPRA